MNLFRLSGLIVVAFLAGCASTGEAPDWVFGASSGYPSGEFLLGRGSGSTVELAQERARADLAKQIEVAVSATAEDLQRAESGGPGGAIYMGRHEQRVQTKTDLVLRGVRNAELWREPESGDQHALAALSRVSASQALRRELARLDEGIEKEIARARAAGDPLAKLGPAQRALDYAGERENADRMLRAVDSTGTGHPGTRGVAALRADRDELISRISIDVEGADQRVLRTLRGALGEAGFASGTAERPAAFRLAAEFQQQDLGIQEGWYWLRATVTINLRDAQGGSRGQHSWAFKASAADPENARTRLFRDIEQTLRHDMRDVIVGFAA